MDGAHTKNEVTAARDHVLLCRDGIATEEEAPPGRFFRSAARVWRQRYRLGPEFALFDGHFPGQPLLPALGQALLARDAAEGLAGEKLAVAGIDQAKFLAMIGPGSVLDVLTAPPRERDGAWLFQVLDMRGGETIEAARLKMRFHHKG